jgi:rsbT co-antagonist protein RsbR
MNNLAEIISQNADSIRKQWIDEMSNAVQRPDLIGKSEMQEQCRAILDAIVSGVKTSGPANLDGTGWDTARGLLTDISASRARQGFSPVEVATFFAQAGTIFSHQKQQQPRQESGRRF